MAETNAIIAKIRADRDARAVAREEKERQAALAAETANVDTVAAAEAEHVAGVRSAGARAAIRVVEGRASLADALVHSYVMCRAAEPTPVSPFDDVYPVPGVPEPPSYALSLVQCRDALIIPTPVEIIDGATSVESVEEMEAAMHELGAEPDMHPWLRAAHVLLGDRGRRLGRSAPSTSDGDVDEGKDASMRPRLGAQRGPGQASDSGWSGMAEAEEAADAPPPLATVHPAVDEMITSLLDAASTDELDALRAEAQRIVKLEGPEGLDFDTAYWTEVLYRIRVRQARSLLADGYDAATRRLEAYLKDAQVPRIFVYEGTLVSASKERVGEKRSRSADVVTSTPADEEEAGAGSEGPDDDGVPRPAGDEMWRDDQDLAALTEQEMYRAEVERGLGEDEEMFAAEAPVAAPRGFRELSRKPLYFNRVFTGYLWNNYNRTHYDKDNPPPKEVRGYHFRIFYPDLADPTKTPTFRLRRDPSLGAGKCTITFSAGPPYEDLCFLIVDKPWNKGRRSGYAARFSRGILELRFHFKQLFYKR
jgi:hypothetical protein